MSTWRCLSYWQEDTPEALEPPTSNPAQVAEGADGRLEMGDRDVWGILSD